MKLIYEPKGRAREYSPLALNIYSGCDHGCRYCYVPRFMRKAGDAPEAMGPSKVRKTYSLEQLVEECTELAGDPRQVLLSFSGDPYCRASEGGETKRALTALWAARMRVAVLTKAGTACLRDLDIFSAFGRHIKVGATLTFITGATSKRWEPGAAEPADRIDMLKRLHAAGVPTWASMEPVIDEAESLAAIRCTLEYVNEYRIGKLNHFEPSGQDWHSYLQAVVDVLRREGKRFVVKRDLREAALEVQLTPEEQDADSNITAPWGKEE
jgi:DNA repair photolyase